MKKPKYIIINNEFRLGWVEFHMDLKSSDEKGIAGGGWWYFLDEDKTELLLYGVSVDFGHLTQEQINNVFAKGIVPKSLDKVEKVFHSTELKLEEAKQNKALLILRKVTNTNS